MGESMRRFTRLFALIVLLAWLGRADAVVLRKASFETLVQRADAICKVRVVDKWIAWNAERSLIYTHYTLEVLQDIKGLTPSRVELTELGGSVGEIAMEVNGVPGYRVGEVAVVLLHAEKGRLMTLNWFQGKFPLIREKSGRLRVAVPDGELLTEEAFTRRVREILAQPASP
jgi:hypothetical protein